MASSRRRRFARIGLAALVATGASALASNVGHVAAAGGLTISEVAPWSSGNSSIGADWFEVTNSSAGAIDTTGWKVDDSSPTFATAAALNGITSIAAGESVIFIEGAPSVAATFRTAWFGATPPAGLQIGTYSGSGIGLSTGGDAVNLYDTTGTIRASVTFGASPSAAPYASFDNATGIDAGAISTLSQAGVNGAFQVNNASDNMIGSPGTATVSAPPTSTTSTTPPTTTPPTGLAWPGSANVQDASTYQFGGNMSGLIEEGSGSATPGVVWAVRNGPGMLFRLTWNGAVWTPDTTSGWAAGKVLRYPDGTGDPDAEGVTFTGAGPSQGIYVSTERNNAVSGTSKLSVLRFDAGGTATTINANAEWNLTADIPATGANLGLEAITWIPDTYLVANNFADVHTGGVYTPANYPGHGDGLFFVGVEGSGMVYAYALDLDGTTYTRIASFSSGFPAVMELQWDRDLSQLWAVCDNTCNGRHNVMRVSGGAFTVAATYQRPAGMPDINNEGFAIAAATECVANLKPVVWADDGETGGVALRSGSIPCTASVIPPSDVPEFPLPILGSLLALGVIGGAIAVARRRPVTA